MLIPSIPLLSALALVLSATVLSLPTAESRRNWPPKHEFVRCPLSPAPALPPSGLPAPAYGSVLKYTVVGRGTQNYTCASNYSAPIAAGAVATLYDISCVVTKGLLRTVFDQKVTPALLRTPQASIEQFVGGLIPCVTIGHHYFRDATTPVFALNDGSFGYVGKASGAAAPAEAKGNKNGAAVDWLKLVRKPEEPKGGIEEVYRVVTAGGRAPATCKKAGAFTVDYVAQYWMYGSA